MKFKEITISAQYRQSTQPQMYHTIESTINMTATLVLNEGDDVLKEVTAAQQALQFSCEGTVLSSLARGLASMEQQNGLYRNAAWDRASRAANAMVSTEPEDIKSACEAKAKIPNNLITLHKAA